MGAPPNPSRPLLWLSERGSCRERLAHISAGSRRMLNHPLTGVFKVRWAEPGLDRNTDEKKEISAQSMYLKRQGSLPEQEPRRRTGTPHLSWERELCILLRPRTLRFFLRLLG